MTQELFQTESGGRRGAPSTRGCSWRSLTPAGRGTDAWHSAAGLRAGRCPSSPPVAPRAAAAGPHGHGLVALEQREPSGHAPAAELRALALLGTAGALRGAPRRAAGPGTQAREPGTQVRAVAGPSRPLCGHILQNPPAPEVQPPRRDLALQKFAAHRQLETRGRAPALPINERGCCARRLKFLFLFFFFFLLLIKILNLNKALAESNACCSEVAAAGTQGFEFG